MTAELLELGTKPVNADAPSGVSARDEPEFALLQAEIRKLELADQPTVNWNVAVDNASKLLSGKSKDLLVAAYLTLALFERDGHAGLTSGLTVLRDLLGNFWDTLWPEAKRIRGRMAAFEWLSERAAAAVRRRGHGGANPEAVKAALERISEIGEKLGPLVEGGAYMLTDLRDALQEIPTEASPPSSSAPAASGASAASFASSSPASSSVPSTLATADDFEKAVAEAKRLMRQSAEFLRNTEKFNPLAYSMPRMAAWLTIKMPPAEGGKTQIPAPMPPDLLDTISGQLAAGQYAGVLENTEGKVATSVFWLDLHRLAAQALERMAPEGKAAADAICEEVASLLKRLPGVAELRFANDQPVANAETREWIGNRIAAMAGVAAPASLGSASPAGGGDGDETFVTVLAEARSLAREKKLAEALRKLEDEAARSGNLRDRVRWKLETARLCLESQQLETALAQLDGLEQMVRDASVESWDPGLCVEVLKLLLIARQRAAAGKTPEDAARGRELLGRLCRLDVVAALELNGKR